jgi:hypothetical protein
MNSYREIRRTGRARVQKGIDHTRTVFSYRLSKEWALFP